jgi:F0F1-type ATP synthase assembly protein I
MGRAARKRTTVKNSDPTLDYLNAFDAKQRFISSVLNMGWRLAVTFMVPVIIGAWLDNRFDSSPSYTLTGIIIGVTASIFVVSNTVKEVNAESAALEKKSKSRKKNA